MVLTVSGKYTKANNKTLLELTKQGFNEALFFMVESLKW